MTSAPPNPGAAARLGTMKAWQYTNANGSLSKSLELNPSVLKPVAATLSKTQVMVQVLAMSPNPADYKIPEETGLADKLMVGRPATPGQDFCGKVAATHVANDVLRVGQLVFGSLGMVQHGSLGEFVVVDMSGCVPLPEGVDVNQAATVGVAGGTAYQAIVNWMGKKAEGSRLFINGGSGGVGTWAIQIGKAIGAHVTVTCSAKNVQTCKDLGADEVLDYTDKEVNVVDALKNHGIVFDHVLDAVGSAPKGLYAESEHFLKPTGHFVQIAADVSLGSAKTIFSRYVTPSFLGGGKRPFTLYFLKTNANDLTQIGQWMAEGKVKGHISQVYPFEEAPKVFEQLKTSRTVGNLVVRVTEA